MSGAKLDKFINKYVGWFMNKFLLHFKTILLAGGILEIIEQICILLAKY